MSTGLELVATRRTMFLCVGVAAVIASVVQIGLGGVVRVTDSGLGCPDWPLCHGQLIPPFEFHTLIEYSHRLSASVLGILVLVGTLIAWRWFRPEPLVFWPMTAALMLVIVAGGLGGVVVLTELEWWVVLLHLAIAETVVALIITATLAAGHVVKLHPHERVPFDGNGWLAAFVVSSLVGAFVIVLSGSYMVGIGYGASCVTWPLCNGYLLPTTHPQFVHMVHRFLTVLEGLVLVAAVVVAWPRSVGCRRLRWVIVGVATIFLAQVLLGALTVWTTFETALKALHLMGGTFFWSSVVFLAGLTFFHSCSVHSRGSSERLLPLELRTTTL